jgi:subtilisin family serine protease
VGVVLVFSMLALGLGAAPSGASSAGDVATSSTRTGLRVWHRPASVAPDLATAAAKGPVPVIAQLSDALPAVTSPGALGARRAAVSSASTRLAAALPARSVSHVQALGSQPLVAMTVDAAGLAALRAEPDVVRVVRNNPNRISTTYQPNISHVGAPTAWAKGDTGSGQTVAILDSGVDQTNAFLSGKVVAEGCFTSAIFDGTADTTPVCPGSDPTTSTAAGSGVPCPIADDGCEHGTHVAGIAAGGNGGAFSGVAPGAKLISVDIFSQVNDSANCAPFGLTTPCTLTYDSDIIRGLDYVYSLRNSFHIAAVNMSLGGTVATGLDAHCDSEPEKPVIDQLRAVGIATVVASGNNGADNVSTPGCISSAIAVGSVDNSDVMSTFTNWSPALSMFAPGEQVLSSVPVGYTGGSACPAPYDASNCALLSGTSMAAPHVAGAIAVLRQAKPGMAVSLEVDQLQGTGVPAAAQDGFSFPSLREGNSVTQMRPSAFGGGVTSNLDGRLEVFRSTSSGVQHKWQTTPNGRWSAWGSLGGPVRGAPVAVTDYDGRIEVFGTASSGALYHAWQTKPGGPWSGWGSLGGSVTSGHFSIFMNPDGHLEMFTATSSGMVQHRWQTTPGGSWSAWANTNLQVAGLRGITTERTAGGFAIVIIVSTTGVEWGENQVSPGGGWSGFGPINSSDGHTPSPPMVGSPVIATDQDGRTQVFSTDTSNRLWHLFETYAQGGFENFGVAVSSGFTSGNLTAGRNVSGKVEVFDERSGGTVVHAWQTTPGGAWSTAGLLPSSVGAISAPIQQLTDLDGRLEVFAPQGGKHIWQTHINGPWLSWVNL